MSENVLEKLNYRLDFFINACYHTISGKKHKKARKILNQHALKRVEEWEYV